MLSTCLGMRPRLRSDGRIHRPASWSIYGTVGFERMNIFMVVMSIKCLESARSLDNGLVRVCFDSSGNLETVQMCIYLSPVDLLTLRGAALLYERVDLLFYHTRNISDTVYNNAQYSGIL